MGGLNKSVLQMFMSKHIYRSIHGTARTSSVIVLCLSFLGFFCCFVFYGVFWFFRVFFVVWWFWGVFLCKYKCFMDYNKISLRAVCRLKHIYTFAVLIKRNLPEGVQIKREPASATANTQGEISWEVSAVRVNWFLPSVLGPVWLWQTTQG